LREYLAAVTRPQATAPGLPVETAISDVRQFRMAFRVAQERASALDRLIEILSAHRVAGRQVHDANIVATHWLSYLYYRRRRVAFFYGTTARIIGKPDDPFLANVADFYLNRALGFRRRACDERRERPSGDEGLGLLSALPESDAYVWVLLSRDSDGHRIAVFAMHVYGC
jgi:hypothetical protein